MRFETKLIYGNLQKDEQTGATNVPIYLSNAYEKTPEEFENIFKGRDIGYVYSRIANPTVTAFEKRMVAIEGGVASTATASGMSSIYLTLMNILEAGDEIIASVGLFGGTYNLIKNLKKLGIKVKFLEKWSKENLKEVITSKTKIVFAETIGNPKLNVLDIKSTSDICNETEVIFIVDSTITTPYLIKPIEYGADIVIHSTSKYINGSANSIGGIIVDGGSKKWKSNRYANFNSYFKRYRNLAFTAKLKSEIGKDVGAVLSPMNSFLNLIGIETLSLRMKQHCENALILAKFLKDHPKVLNVNYPGLESSKYYKYIDKYYNKKGGGILTFRVGTKEKAFALMNNLKLIGKVLNISDTKTLIIHPSSTICIDNTIEEKNQMGVYDDLLRISVGIESIEDIIEDLSQGLEKI